MTKRLELVGPQQLLTRISCGQAVQPEADPDPAPPIGAIRHDIS
jgi:hypothetical protein